MKIIKILKIFALTAFLVAFGFFAAKYFSSRPGEKNKKEAVAKIANESSPAGEVLGEEERQAISKMYQSQNYHMVDLSFGGDAIVLPSGQQSTAPEIQDMKSELLLEKKDQSVKFLLVWKTNKLCQASIEYVKEGWAEGKTIAEDGYGLVHSAEIEPLSYSTSYSYIVTVRDKWGNERKSEKLSFYTGSPNVSIFDILNGAFKDMFGWATR